MQKIVPEKMGGVNHKNEITLRDIYDWIAGNYLLTEMQIKELMALEEDIELEYSFPIKAVVDEIKELLSKGKKVIFISDMYLSYDAIRRMLIKADKDFAKIPLYVSSYYNATKRKGDLFKIVAAKENVKYCNWLHAGDNFTSDVNVPKSLGIKTKHINYISNDALMRYFDFQLRNNIFSHIYGGCTKIALMCKNSRNYNIGCKYGAPILLGYSEWILDLALRKHIKEIYFVARDGYIVKRICDLIIKDRGYQLSTKYFYGSRKAFNNKEPQQVDLIKKYIIQEIDLKQPMILFVDLFGTGNSIEEIAKKIQEVSDGNVCSAYIKRGGCNYNYNIAIKCEYASRIDIYDNIEIFSSAPEGSCQGYLSDDNGKIKPLCDNEMTKKMLDYGYQDYIDGIDKFIDIYLRLPYNADYRYCSTLDVLEEYIEKINFFPSNELIQFLVEYPEKKQGIIFKNIRKIELKIKQYKYLIRLIEKRKIFNLIKSK